MMKRIALTNGCFLYINPQYVRSVMDDGSHERACIAQLHDGSEIQVEGSAWELVQVLGGKDA